MTLDNLNTVPFEAFEKLSPNAQALVRWAQAIGFAILDAEDANEPPLYSVIQAAKEICSILPCRALRPFTAGSYQGPADFSFLRLWVHGIPPRKG